MEIFLKRLSLRRLKMTYEERPTNEEIVCMLEAYEKQPSNNYGSMRLNAHNIGAELDHFCPSLGLGKPETVDLKMNLKMLAQVLDEGLDEGGDCNPKRIQGLHQEVLGSVRRAKIELI